VRITEKASTRIRLRVDRFIGEDRQAHLLRVFGNDSDVDAITAAVHEKAAFSLTFPYGRTKDVSLSEHASCHTQGEISIEPRLEQDLTEIAFWIRHPSNGRTSTEGSRAAYVLHSCSGDSGAKGAGTPPSLADNSPTARLLPSGSAVEFEDDRLAQT
jgi:hypothetical protein